MSRYIDADAFFEEFCELDVEPYNHYPTADVVEVVRCKDCKNGEFKSYAPPSCRYYCKNSTNYHSKDFYCSMGER